MNNKKKKKLTNKKSTLRILGLSGIKYRTTDGIGYQIRYQDCKVDFWPTVGKWREMPYGKTQRGIKSLVEFVETSGLKAIPKKPLLAKPSFPRVLSKVSTDAQHRQRKIMAHFGMNFD